MRKKVLEWVQREKIIAIVRGVSSEKCLRVAEALYVGGIRLMEITYDQKAPESWQATAEAIESIAKQYVGRMLVGAGTVTNIELVELTAKHGGSFIVSPDTNLGVIKRTSELGMASFPGAMTPTEIKISHDAGADMVKVFPAGNLGVGYMKSVKAPLSHIKLLAVGGINEKNAAEYLRAGAVGVGVGGNLAKAEWINGGEFDKLAEAARLLVSAVRTEDK